jgi:2-desacetyl-2-hydroxyethyl bacteriochlorophyllide A dehydrogenase
MTMRQVSYEGKGEIVMREAERKTPGSRQVTIAVAYTGICGTDLHIYHGDMDGRVQPGDVIGHEMSGRVVEVGSDVTEWSIGQHATVMPLDPCGDCLACRRGYSHVCQNLNFIGIDSSGSMQEFWTVPEDTVIPLPEDLPFLDAALVEPTAVAVHDVRRSGLKAGDKALVVGSGPVGTLIALVAKEVGAEVLVLETNPYRQQLAHDLGLDVVNPRDADVQARIDEWTQGGGADVAFEVSGVPAGLDSALASLAVRGTLCLVAVHTTKPPVDMHRVFWRELTVVGTRLYVRDDFTEAVRLVAAGLIPAKQMVTAVYPLDRAAAAFQALQSGGNVMKVLVGDGLETPR